jgi:hypothetical protein
VGGEKGGDEEENESSQGGDDDGAITERYVPPTKPSPSVPTIFTNDFLSSFWEPESKPPFTDDTLNSVERNLGFKLPSSFIELLRYQNGGHPELKCVDTEHRHDIDDIMSIAVTGDGNICVGHENYIGEWQYPRIGVYFGNCPSGGQDAFCLDYSKCGVDGEPAVAHVVQTHAGWVSMLSQTPRRQGDYQKTVVAASFEAYVRGLRFVPIL